jgi:hypothetical protein
MDKPKTPAKLMALYNPSIRQKETGSPFERSKASPNQVDRPSVPILSVQPAFRLVQPKAKYQPMPPLMGAPQPSLRPPTASHTTFLRSRSGMGGTIGAPAGALAGNVLGLTASARAGFSQLAAATVVGGGAPHKRPPTRLGVWGAGPPPALPFRPRHNPANCDLRAAFERGDLPCAILHGTKMRLNWRVPIDALDLAFYLPLFASGLRENEFPYSFIAEEGFANLLVAFPPDKVAAVVPLLITPLRDAINTRQPQPMVRTIRAIKALASVGGEEALGEGGGGGRSGRSKTPTLVGAALLPFYRQLLPTMNLYAQKNLNLGDKIDYGQRFHRSMGEAIAEVLRVLDLTGGETAFMNILYSVPTYVRAI